MRLALLFTATISSLGCMAESAPSCRSIEHAQSKGVLIASYPLDQDAELPPYRIKEVWIENDRNLVVRLDGPHVDDEPRVNVRGLDRFAYRTIWSEPNGPPYEIWTLPGSPPDSIVLEREGNVIELAIQR
ncbi:hypothetical protein Enr13x_10770 [Stieleria neptunia]|uniref:Uncharacterized protein n=1 Tax=Stieleria neptunia TaxID=2527979 RepID=A0A518HKE3_9BACT|nr:hypothetical protein Enr13x_10770 [Stieleria neptunia]